MLKYYNQYDQSEANQTCWNGMRHKRWITKHPSTSNVQSTSSSPLFLAEDLMNIKRRTWSKPDLCPLYSLHLSNSSNLVTTMIYAIVMVKLTFWISHRVSETRKLNSKAGCITLALLSFDIDRSWVLQGYPNPSFKEKKAKSCILRKTALFNSSSSPLSLLSSYT